ncbi:transcriptional regulator, LysR family [Clostridium sp. DL-VIII]|uniref:LysR family transcriptional regulator n=1 Tax=Clostridium sp. DL-VIII TaxID=641107 RepID=UPI00023B0226|nr:LysR family transcriptional regulator [Clostridium sp. DL-VIII]EHI99906.1 transcriptional regulator, LysR family [Clostridium sp. DL-VIII]
MINQMKTFIQVADNGSFSKAAEKLFISPTAVIKQINILESIVGVPLLYRTNHGIHLSEAGKSFYQDSKKILNYTAAAILHAQKTVQENTHVIHLGTSLLSPCKVLLDIWNEIREQYPQFKIKIVPFEDEPDAQNEATRYLGKNFDVFVVPKVIGNWIGTVQALKLGEYRFCFAVSIRHHLSQKKVLSLTDLHGEKLIITRRGTSGLIDSIRDFIMTHHPEIQIIEGPPHYSIDVFNRCEQGNEILLTLDAWDSVHPSLLTIPSDLNFVCPYGLLYPAEPTSAVLEFINILKTAKFEALK